eukprot:5438715-Prymnesium_polylepis.1
MKSLRYSRCRRSHLRASFDRKGNSRQASFATDQQALGPHLPRHQSCPPQGYDAFHLEDAAPQCLVLCARSDGFQ